ncbi:autotransporter domain-containing protein, partial [Ralstonia pseudosolanacearum]
MNGMHSNPMRGLLPTGKSAVWTAGDVGRAEHGDHDSDVGVAEIGFGHRVHDRLQLNLALGRTFSRSKTDLGGKTIARGTYLMPEAILSLPASLYLTASAFYGRGEADIERGYLNAGRTEFVSASPDQRSAGARLR